MESRRKIPSAPSYLLWEITLRCNFRCVHCAAGAGRGRRSELTTREALSVCNDIKALGVSSVALMGGEPLVRKDWKLIVEELRRLDINVGIVTNGFLFTEEVAEFCAQLGVSQVCVSLDGAEAEVHDYIRNRKGAFVRAIEAINLMCSMELPYRTVITSVNKMNINQLEGMYELLVSFGEDILWIINYSSTSDFSRMDAGWMIEAGEFIRIVKFICDKRKRQRRRKVRRLTVTATHGTGYFSANYPDLYDYEWKGCVAGIETLGIRSDGRVVGCLILPPEFDEGNVTASSLKDIWNLEAGFSYTRRFDARRLRGKCYRCEHGKECMAGCTNISYSVYGHIYEAPFCLFDMERQREGGLLLEVR